jgi:hypothetical protein
VDVYLLLYPQEPSAGRVHLFAPELEFELFLFPSFFFFLKGGGGEVWDQPHRLLSPFCFCIVALPSYSYFVTRTLNLRFVELCPILHG